MKHGSNPSSYAEFTDPKLVAIYDAVNPIGSYAPFYLDLVKRLGAKKIIDFGCGTGLLSHEIAKLGHKVIGVEPAPAMLEQAEQKYGTEAQWLLGGTERLTADMQADLIVMTGHVAQFFLQDYAWRQALQRMQSALKPGGCLAFESRNPLTPPFTDWPTANDHRKLLDTPLGTIEWWVDNLVYRQGYAAYDIHYLFDSTGDELISANKLRFRGREELAASLKAAGFSLEEVFGDWDKRPVNANSQEMIFLARTAFAPESQPPERPTT